MSNHIAALLYLLGRRVTTAVRVRCADGELAISRLTPMDAALRDLRAALQAGAFVAVDPWVDLETGDRGLLGLWLHVTDPEVVAAQLPEEIRPQVRVAFGGTITVLWLLDQPSAQPGGYDPGVAIRTIAGALGARASDPRDYIPVPAEPSDLDIIDPTRTVDATLLLRWAESVLMERAARQEAAARSDLRRVLVKTLRLLAIQRARNEEEALRLTVVAARLSDEPSSPPGDPQPPDAASTDGPPIPVSSSVERAASPALSTVEGSSTALPAWRTTSLVDATLDTDELILEARRALDDLASRASDANGDQTSVDAVVRWAMSILGTHEVWARLKVEMTCLRDGALFGYRDRVWVPLRDLIR